MRDAFGVEVISKGLVPDPLASGVGNVARIAASPAGSAAVAGGMLGAFGVMHAKNQQATKDGDPPSKTRKVLTGATALGAAAPLVLAKDYQRGSITQHQQQANLHSRKRTSGRRQVSAGTAIAGVGAAAMHPSVSSSVGSAFHDAVKPGMVREHGSFLGRQKAVRAGQRATRAARAGAAGAVVGGAGLAGVGAVRVVHHGMQQNKQTKAAQAARQRRNATLGKADRKRGAAEATLATGSVGAGVHAGMSRRTSQAQADASRANLDVARRGFAVTQQRLTRHALTPGKGALPPTRGNVARTAHGLTIATNADQKAHEAARASWRAARRAKGSTAAAVALGAGAAAVHQRSPKVATRPASYR